MYRPNFFQSHNYIADFTIATNTILNLERNGDLLDMERRLNMKTKEIIFLLFDRLPPFKDLSSAHREMHASTFVEKIEKIRNGLEGLALN